MNTFSTFAVASALYIGTETICSRETYEAIRPLARGSYQAGLLNDRCRWSGADLKGKASRYGARYAESRAGLLARLRKAGYVVTRATGARGRVVMVVETPEEAARREALVSGADVATLAPVAKEALAA